MTDRVRRFVASLAVSAVTALVSTLVERELELDTTILWLATGTFVWVWAILEIPTWVPAHAAPTRLGILAAGLGVVVIVSLSSPDGGGGTEPPGSGGGASGIPVLLGRGSDSATMPDSLGGRELMFAASGSLVAFGERCDGQAGQICVFLIEATRTTEVTVTAIRDTSTGSIGSTIGGLTSSTTIG